MVCWRCEVILLLARATVTRVALSMAYSSTTMMSTTKTTTIMMRGTLMAMSLKRHSYLIIRVVIKEMLTRSILRTSALGTSESPFIMPASAFITTSTNWSFWFLLIVVWWHIIVLLTTSGMGTDSCDTLSTVQFTMFWMCWVGACANPCLTVYIDFDAAFAWRCTHSFWFTVLVGFCVWRYVNEVCGLVSRIMQDC